MIYLFFEYTIAITNYRQSLNNKEIGPNANYTKSNKAEWFVRNYLL